MFESAERRGSPTTWAAEAASRTCADSDPAGLFHEAEAGEGYEGSNPDG